jgi:ubiquinone/menaquinone biosynthesis C-methylase UbiE
MPRDIDALTSSTLKHLRERWWDATFTQFLVETLQPRAGNRILDVGCGAGMAELNLSLLQLSQVELIGVDVVFERAREALAATTAHNIGAHFANADTVALPFATASFDSTFCVAVLQHVNELPATLREFARVTKPGGRVLAVEPDNSARYWYSSIETGNRAFELSTHFFRTLAEIRGDTTDPQVGPKLPGMFARQGIQPLAVKLFPVSVSRLGAPAPAVWKARREAVQQAITKAPDEAIRRFGLDYIKLLDRYAEESTAAGAAFVEIQNTMLFATVGQTAEE